ncbi:response regulator [Microbacterium sp. BK668]|uniref:response regulator n=1 Tax=Microbacterium sp. BK668 TaxID=2512118 RepID=UPI00106074DB|nr:response regulator [Microbacterium sp. BK668]TDN92851.1 two-component system cell cycle response regulator DivK [Microbacterium sp. BK668]
MPAERILVVEDNPLNLKLVRGVLRASGFDVIEASTGEDGVARALAEPPDLVLMDLQLPGIDGYEALRRLRDEGPPDLPVVALTAFAMGEDRAKALAAGFDGYLTKPIGVVELRRYVHDLLPKREPS